MKKLALGGAAFAWRLPLMLGTLEGPGVTPPPCPVVCGQEFNLTLSGVYMGTGKNGRTTSVRG